MPGGRPRLVTIIEPGRVATWVWPAPFTVMSLPNTKVEPVWLGLTSRMVMPPRMRCRGVDGWTGHQIGERIAARSSLNRAHWYARGW